MSLQYILVCVPMADHKYQHVICNIMPLIGILTTEYSTVDFFLLRPLLFV